ncbi:hypothetical protein N7517_000232 [Penicillium concentricum]|uniref:Uncharacterized protein n=1 Tax=Penicillium concentricum TaxID=293559 RepID=A0A9W9SPK4_9EURO|nr:uncharacterized protein N7517_000232 [Penicillium concentricum]KAJ5382321.1 hypothetical protein N7517_000232 [Penicillium concentricum]
MKQPSATSREYYMTLELPLNRLSRRPASDNTDRSPPHGLRQDTPVPLSTSSEPVQLINPFITAEMLRTNSVPWHVSPA